jgi:hypothetical protein
MKLQNLNQAMILLKVCNQLGGSSGCRPSPFDRIEQESHCHTDVIMIDEANNDIHKVSNAFYSANNECLNGKRKALVSGGGDVVTRSVTVTLSRSPQ